MQPYFKFQSFILYLVIQIYLFGTVIVYFANSKKDSPQSKQSQSANLEGKTNSRRSLFRHLLPFFNTWLGYRSEKELALFA